MLPLHTEVDTEILLEGGQRTCPSLQGTQSWGRSVGANTELTKMREGILKVFLNREIIKK